MKKLSILLLYLLCVSSHLFGQQDWGKYSETYPESQIGIVTCIEARNDDFKSLVKYNYTSTDFEVNKAAMEAHKRERSGNNTFVNVFSETPAYFFLKNVNSSNAEDYEYRVTDNADKVVVPWSNISHFYSPGFNVGDGVSNKMGFLGGYKTDYGHRIIVELRRKDSQAIMSKAVTEWVSIKPSVTRVYTTDQLNEFFNDLTHEWTNKNPKYPDLTKLKSSQNNLIFLLNSKITHKSQIEYQVERNGKLYLSWRQNEFDNNFIWLKSLPYGKYKIKYRYTIQKEHVGSCIFVIKPAWYQSTAIKVISGSLLAAFLGLIVTVTILLRHRQKAVVEAEKQKQLQMELQVIRAQLNPHFIFNALTSIQGLVNKQDITGANNYLTEFSLLLRNTLSNIELEQLPLAKEVKILETYLNLEKLRFNFNYYIHISEDINIYETEIPSLLLQPLLENAIKHGLSNLKGTGNLLLSFKIAGNDMIATVSDNGNGFEVNTANIGYGLKLVRKRIELLNDVLKNSKIMLTINSDQTSMTEIELTFINWLV